MNTYKDLVYMVLDEIKGSSDDFSYTEEHVIYLLNKYRAAVLKQKYADVKKVINEANYQTICLSVVPVTLPYVGVENGTMLRSTVRIPYIINIGIPRVYPLEYYVGDIAFISRDRMRYVGHNPYLQGMIYCSIAPDHYLYFKSNNPQLSYLQNVKFTAIFNDTQAASDLQCPDNNGNSICDTLDREFPLEDSLIPTVIGLTVKDLSDSEYRPDDNNNDGNDNLSQVGMKKTSN